MVEGCWYAYFENVGNTLLIEFGAANSDANLENDGRCKD